MPRELDRCVQELKRQGYSESEAWAICQSRMNSKKLEEVEGKYSTNKDNVDTFRNLKKWFSRGVWK